MNVRLSALWVVVLDKARNSNCYLRELTLRSKGRKLYINRYLTRGSQHKKEENNCILIIRNRPGSQNKQLYINDCLTRLALKEREENNCILITTKQYWF